MTFAGKGCEISFAPSLLLWLEQLGQGRHFPLTEVMGILPALPSNYTHCYCCLEQHHLQFTHYIERKSWGLPWQDGKGGKQLDEDVHPALGDVAWLMPVSHSHHSDHHIVKEGALSFGDNFQLNSF